jgi:hypothetical protein
MTIFEYKQEDIKEDIRVTWCMSSFHACCGAKILHNLRVDVYSFDGYDREPITKELWAKVDKALFYKRFKEKVNTYMPKGKRIYSTCVYPVNVRNTKYAYYDRTGTKDPAITQFILMKKLGWEMQKPWINGSGGNTLVTFYKDPD